MNSLAIVEKEGAAKKVRVTEDELIVELVDGRTISVPITWYPRLLYSSKKERNTYELMGRGTNIHWPLLDEDISISGILRGYPSGESEESLKAWMETREKRK